MRTLERMKWAIALPIAALAVSAALATNGMYLAGYGGEAAGRGGANLAVSDRALGLQSNPAGIAQLMGNHYSYDVQVLLPELSLNGDPFGNDISGKDQTYVMPAFSYVHGGDQGWTWGLGMVSQGGMGALFDGYDTAFATVDGTQSEVRFATLVPAVAYSLSEDLSVGLSANAGWSDVEFEFFPQTSFYNDAGTPTDPSDDMGFFGPAMTERATAFNYSFRLGMMWRATPSIQLGAVYQTKTEGDYEDGTLTLDQSSIGMGYVNYDAEVDGFSWPEQYGFGVQFRPSDRWILALDVKQYLWSDVIEVITVRGTNPDAPSPMDVVELPFVFLWEDQTVVALGTEFRLNDYVTLRAGYNHGDSPVPDNTLNPLFPATVEEHAAIGIGWNFGNWTLNAAWEHGFENTQTNMNTDPMVNPFGPGLTVDHAQDTFSIGFSRAIARRARRGA